MQSYYAYVSFKLKNVSFQFSRLNHFLLYFSDCFEICEFGQNEFSDFCEFDKSESSEFNEFGELGEFIEFIEFG